MPRRGKLPKRDVLADPVYNSKTVTRLINKVMLDGKRNLAERIVYGSLDLIRERTNQDPLEVLETAMKNIQPVLEVRPGGGRAYQVPMEVRPERRASWPLELWIRQERSERTMIERLARRFSTPQTIPAVRCGRRKKCIVWRKPTRPSPIIAGNSGHWARGGKSYCLREFHWRKRGILESWPISTLGRQLPPSGSCSIPAVYTDWAKCKKVPPPWTGWCRRRSGGSPSPLLLPPVCGRIIILTLSIRRTRDLPLRWSARACLGAAVFCAGGR